MIAHGEAPSLWHALGLADVDLSWHDHAVCNQTDPDAFFPEKGGSTEAAKRICHTCPVRAECLAYALDHNEHFGIWGGVTERERRLLRRTRQHADTGTEATNDLEEAA